MFRVTKSSWDTAAEEDTLPTVPAARLVGHKGSIQAIQFTADGKYCLTGGQDRAVRLWNPTRIDPVHLQPPPKLEAGGSYPLAVIPHALSIQTYEGGYGTAVSALTIDSASSVLIASSDKVVVVTDVVTAQVKCRFHGHTGLINAVALTNGPEVYLSASYDSTVRIWDARSRTQTPIQILSDATDSVACVEVVDEQDASAQIVTASVDGKVRTYDIRMGQVQCDDVGDAVTGMALSHDGNCLAASCVDGTIRLVERETGHLLNTYASSHMAGNYALQCTMTADDAHVMSGSEDGCAVFYDLVRGKGVIHLEGHSRPTCSIACHPKRDSNSIAITASYDGEAIVWGNDKNVHNWEGRY